jgi:TetR/AcrR family transcriptional regulator, cholesterol catabolism regulator
MPKGIPLTEAGQASRKREILAAAVQLFFEKGFTETSMREISAAAGTGKSTLYDYFKTKEDILVAYFEDEMLSLTRRAEIISQKDLPVVDKLRQILQAHLDYLLANKKFYLKLSIEAQRLGLESQQRIQAERHAYQDLIRALIEAGSQDGSFRAVDPLLTMRVALAMLTPVAFTTRPSGTPQEMLDSALEILLKGIQT